MTDSACHLYRTPLLAPIVLPYSVSFVEQVHVCSTVRPRLSDTDRWRGKGWPLRLRTKEPLRCTTYALLPHSHSPHNNVHSPSITYMHVRTSVLQ